MNPPRDKPTPPAIGTAAGPANKPVVDAQGEPGNFFSRWSQRKARVARGEAVAEPVATPPLAGPRDTGGPADGARRVEAVAPRPVPPPAEASASTPVPTPTLDDVNAQAVDGDFSRFVARGVDSPVRNAALRKLFTDPHFNVMDGLDTYIEDFGIPDPLPARILEQMTGSRFMGLFTERDAPAEAPPIGLAGGDPKHAAGTAQPTLDLAPGGPDEATNTDAYTPQPTSQQPEHPFDLTLKPPTCP